MEAAAAEAALQLETFNRQAEEAIQSLRGSPVTVDFPKFDAVTIESKKTEVGNAARGVANSVAKARSYDGTNSSYHQVVKITNIVKIKFRQRFPAVTKRNATREGSFQYVLRKYLPSLESRHMSRSQ